MNLNQVRKPLIRVAIAAESLSEAHRMSHQLNAQQDITVVGAATSASELENILFRKEVDVLVTDVSLEKKDVMPLIPTILSRCPNLNVLCFTEVCDEGHVIRAVQAGVTGYVLRSANEDLPNCVRLIHGGGSPVSPIVARFVIRTLYSRGRPAVQALRSDTQRLSNRESEILQLLAKGIPFADIGSILSISPHTVTAHIKKIYRKLQVHSRGEAVYEAKCLGLLPDL